VFYAQPTFHWFCGCLFPGSSSRLLKIVHPPTQTATRGITLSSGFEVIKAKLGVSLLCSPLEMSRSRSSLMDFLKSRQYLGGLLSGYLLTLLVDQYLLHRSAIIESPLSGKEFLFILIT
jgi:hypothetical protein